VSINKWPLRFSSADYQKKEGNNGKKGGVWQNGRREKKWITKGHNRDPTWKQEPNFILEKRGQQGKKTS